MSNLSEKEIAIGLLFPDDMRDRIDRFAEARGLTRSEFLMQAAKAMMAG